MCSSDLFPSHDIWFRSCSCSCSSCSSCRRWLERIRKRTGKSVKHWLVTELGHEGTERIHLHGIIMSNDIELLKRWNYGNYWIGEYVNEKTINYIVKYINRIDTDHKGYTPKVLCSKGIGKNYLKSYNALQNKYNDNDTKEYYIMKDGSKINLPKYYRNNIYSEEQREKLWRAIVTGKQIGRAHV